MDAESVLYGSRANQEIDLDELTFKLVVRSPSYTVTLMAPSVQEKAAWTSDISQVRIYKGHEAAANRKCYICTSAHLRTETNKNR